MNKSKSEVLRMFRTKRILALVSAVAVGVAVFAAMGMFSSPQQVEASNKVVVVYEGVVGVGIFPIKVGGQLSGVDLNNLSGAGFDQPIRPGSRFYCRFPLVTTSVVGDVVTLEGDTIFSNNTFVNDNPVHVIMTLNVVTGDISFTFDPGGAVTGGETFLTGTGKVRIAGHS